SHHSGTEGSAIDATRSLKRFFVNFLWFAIVLRSLRKKLYAKVVNPLRALKLKSQKNRTPKSQRSLKSQSNLKSQICHQSQSRISPSRGHQSGQNHHPVNPVHHLNPVQPQNNWLRFPLPVWPGTFGLTTLSSRVVRNATEAMVVEHAITVVVASLWRLRTVEEG
ncbi:hypothetical protein PanWU01x14_310880, partial [Parasponia andersonii]